jgi:hypothetical protein
LLNLLDNYKGLASPIIENGSTILFWDDQWNNGIPKQQYPELFSFADDTKLSIVEVKQKEHYSKYSNYPSQNKPMSNIWTSVKFGTELS